MYPAFEAVAKLENEAGAAGLCSMLWTRRRFTLSYTAAPGMQ